MKNKKEKEELEKTNDSKESKNKKLIIFIALTIAVIIIVATVFVFFTNKDGEKPENISSGEEKTENISNEEESIEEQSEESNAEKFYKEEEGTKINTSEKVLETKVFEGLEISNATLKELDNNSTFIATLTNKTNGVSGDFFLDLKFVDKNNNEIATISCRVDSVEPGQSIELNSSATANLANAYDYTIIKQ